MRRRAVGNCLSPDLLWVLRVDFGMSASCPVRVRSDACGQRKPCPVYPRQPTARQSAFGSGPGAAIVATVDEGHSLSEHANPLRSVHANRASGATS